MRNLISYGLLIVSFTFVASKSVYASEKETESDSLFQYGVVALADEDFEVAEGLLLQDVELQPSFEGYYNLSQAYIGQENYFKAYWAAEKALKFAPNNNMAKENIRFTLGELNSDVKASHTYSWLERFIVFIPDFYWFLIGLIFSVLSAYFLYKLTTKGGAINLIFTLAFAIVLLLTIAAGRYHYSFYNNEFYATPTENEIQTFAGKNGIRLNQVLTAGQRYKILKQKEGWVKLEFLDGQPVWVEKESLLLI